MRIDETRRHIKNYKNMCRALRDAAEQQLSPLEKQIEAELNEECTEFRDRIRRSVDNYVVENRLNDEVPGIGDMGVAIPRVYCKGGMVILNLLYAVSASPVIYRTDLHKKYKIYEPDISLEEKARRKDLCREEEDKITRTNSRIWTNAVISEVQKILLEYQIDMANLSDGPEGKVHLKDLK